MNLSDIQRLAGHRVAPAWVVKLVLESVQEERAANAALCDKYATAIGIDGKPYIRSQECALAGAAIRARGME